MTGNKIERTTPKGGASCELSSKYPINIVAAIATENLSPENRGLLGQPILRPWGNDRCPCLHADPKIPDCEPGETQRLVGWLSFYEGDDLDAELERIEKTEWRRLASGRP